MKKSFILLSSALLLVALTFGSCGSSQKPAEETKSECCEKKDDKACCEKKDTCKHEHSDTTKCAGKHEGEKKHKHGKDCKH